MQTAHSEVILVKYFRKMSCVTKGLTIHGFICTDMMMQLVGLPEVPSNRRRVVLYGYNTDTIDSINYRFAIQTLK